MHNVDPPPLPHTHLEFQERLKSHARAFEGLMSLIPAKDYYGKDESITSVCYPSFLRTNLG